MMDCSQHVAIFWDLENCPIPSTSSVYQTVGGIRTALENFGPIKSFRAYTEMYYPSPRLSAVRSELQRSGISIIDCPHTHSGQKDVVDKMLIVDMAFYAIENPKASIVLISGDRDYAYLVSSLRLRHHNVIVILPSDHVHQSLFLNASHTIRWEQLLSPPILDIYNYFGPDPIDSADTRLHQNSCLLPILSPIILPEISSGEALICGSSSSSESIVDEDGFDFLLQQPPEQLEFSPTLCERLALSPHSKDSSLGTDVAINIEDKNPNVSKFTPDTHADTSETVNESHQLVELKSEPDISPFTVAVVADIVPSSSPEVPPLVVPLPDQTIKLDPRIAVQVKVKALEISQPQPPNPKLQESKPPLNPGLQSRTPKLQDVPPMFKPLVQILENLRSTGQYPVKDLTQVYALIARQDPKFMEKHNIKKWSQYRKQALEKGIILITGEKKKKGLRLHPRWHAVK